MSRCNQTMDWVGTSLIESVGGQGNAEIIVSRAFTSSIGANCYLPECKAYGHSSPDCGLFWYDEDDRQFKKCDPTTVVMLDDLEKELKQVAA